MPSSRSSLVRPTGRHETAGRLAALLLALVAPACGASSAASDGGVSDGDGGGDAAPADAVDVARPNDASPDASPRSDAGVSDAPSGSDAAPVDAARPDATLADASRPDAALPDAAPADAPAPDAPAADADPPGSWRSALYPAGWMPVQEGGQPTADGRYLHDFSYAGYHRGDVDPPVGVGNAFRALRAADYGDGTGDATAAIQGALDAACTAGGGVVALSAGTFRLTFPRTTPAPPAALRISCSHVVLRGAGSANTRLFLDDPTAARGRSLLLIRPTSAAVKDGNTTDRPNVALTQDVGLPTRVVHVQTVTGFTPGDLIGLRTDLTATLRADYGMNTPANGDTVDYWRDGRLAGPLYLRRVAAVDAAASTLTLDAPTREPMKMRDNLRVYRTVGVLTEVGVESLAMGMREHATSASGTLPGPLGDQADTAGDTSGTAAYDVNDSRALTVNDTVDAWISDVRTYMPSANASGAHILSIGLALGDTTARITVDRSDFSHPQYRGGGGNGYTFWVQGADHLLRDVSATAARHSVTLSSMSTSGLVVLRMHSTDARFADDTHRLLSPANLWDGEVLDRAFLDYLNRMDTSSGAGMTTTETVVWNVHVVANHRQTLNKSPEFPLGFAVETAQHGWGYVIGTSAEAGAGDGVSTTVLTNSTWAMAPAAPPTDWVEGVGQGSTLFPTSLYEDQLSRRRARGGR